MKTPVFEDVVKGVVSRVSEQLNLSDDLNAILRKSLSSYRVDYFAQQDFTTAVLTSKHDQDEDRLMFVGVSKRNPEDKQNILRGRALALSRAVKDAVRFELGRARFNETMPSPVTLKEVGFVEGVLNKVGFKA